MYRGGPGMLAWVLHRITGVAVLLFLFMHILETTMVGFGPDLYNATLAIYKQRWFKPVEFLLVAAVIYHAGNGIIVMLLDFWPNATRAYRTMVWAGAVIYAAIVIPLGAFMMRGLFGF